MKARPILFSAPMVRALLDGRKTQTRRIVKGFPCPSGMSIGDGLCIKDEDGGPAAVCAGNVEHLCPHGVPGDLLWVRETWRPDGMKRPGDPASYCADWDDTVRVKWRPSIHMPRWASRLTLRITDVRVERLQDISEEDAANEGLGTLNSRPDHIYSRWDSDPRDEFAELWNSINGPDAWHRNDWVWVVAFDVLKQNVDDVLREAA